MRYQSKPYRSLSYVQREANNIREPKDIRQNKENSNYVNIPTSKPIKPKDLDSNPLCSLKLEHKISATTTYTTSEPSVESFTDQLKRTYSLNVRKDYSIDILTHLCSTSEGQTDFLNSHNITPSLRSKMVDWMIEVLSSYKMSEETFFRGVYLMDSYLKNCDHKLQVKDLHLIGVTSMFSAAKYQQIHPLKLNVIYDKIARKKFKKTEILDKESQIIKTLNFVLEVPSVYDITRHVVEQLKLPLTDASKRYFNKIVLYLSKMALFNDELAGQSPSLLSCGVVFIGLKTLEQVDCSALPESKLPQLCALMQIQEEEILEISRKVLELAKNFSKIYPSLTNLKKFNKFEYGID